MLSPRPAFRQFIGLVIVFLSISAAPIQSMATEDAKLTVELNKFEASESAGCRAYFLFRNQSGKAFEGFEMSLAVLDTQGVIDRLLNIDAAPLPVERTTLKLFEIPEIACTDISEILLHAIDSCKPQNEAEIDCFPIVNLVSRTSAPLVK